MDGTDIGLAQKHLDFIKRRITPHVNVYQSIETIAAQCYIQGMNDTIDALDREKAVNP